MKKANNTKLNAKLVIKKANGKALKNSVVGAAIGGAIGGLAGAALTDKKTRKIFGDMIVQLTRAAVDSAEKLRNYSEDVIDAVEIIKSPKSHGKKKTKK